MSNFSNLASYSANLVDYVSRLVPLHRNAVTQINPTSHFPDFDISSHSQLPPQTVVHEYSIWAKVGQIGSKWDTSRIFQIRFQYILARWAKMYWNLIWKNPGFVSSICPTLAQIWTFCSRNNTPRVVGSQIGPNVDQIDTKFNWKKLWICYHSYYYGLDRGTLFDSLI